MTSDEVLVASEGKSFNKNTLTNTLPLTTRHYCSLKGLSEMRKKAKAYSVEGRMWIAKGEETFLGYGRIVLLERIKEYGSITKAAKSMDMSYRHAWELVESMNRQAGAPLVETATGGKGGGGAFLTPIGEKAITIFWNIYDEFNSYMASLSNHLFELRGNKKCLKK